MARGWLCGLNSENLVSRYLTDPAACVELKQAQMQVGKILLSVQNTDTKTTLTEPFPIDFFMQIHMQ